MEQVLNTLFVMTQNAYIHLDREILAAFPKAAVPLLTKRSRGRTT